MNYFTPGRIITTFLSKGNKEIIIRYPEWNDIVRLTAYLNSISKGLTVTEFKHIQLG